MQTDPYLEQYSNYYRLLHEYNKYNSLMIAVDFDDTLYDYHKKGHTYTQVAQLVRNLKSINCEIIIWTGNQNLEFVKQYLEDNNIPYDKINEECETTLKYLYENGDKPIPRKLYANAYLDDRAGLLQMYIELDLLFQNVKANKNDLL